MKVSFRFVINITLHYRGHQQGAGHTGRDDEESGAHNVQNVHHQQNTNKPHYQDNY